ncbi:MAG: hypothetical protein S4CHLAM102_15790 [Chlamydiia bacterium]|nr:hypothetical protein [Chlamydiia bacterium]
MSSKHQRVTHSKKTAIRDCKEKGLGVFALEPIKAGEIIESCPTIELDEPDTQVIMGTYLSNYAFAIENEDDDDISVLALGNGMMYNHAIDFNADAEFETIFDREWMVVTALRDIEEGEEITLNYNGEEASTKPLWFEEDS